MIKLIIIKKSMKIYCSSCKKDVDAILTNGKEIYPHRKDLSNLPFWKCHTCNNYVGCHHKTSDITKPLGIIPTEELRKSRQCIHSLLDPLWKSGKIKRGKLYKKITKELGYQYHSAEIRNIEEARKIYLIILKISKKYENSTLQSNKL